MANSLHKYTVAEAQNAAMGQAGAIFIDDTAQHTGPFYAIQGISSAALDVSDMTHDITDADVTESKAKSREGVGDFLETPELQKIRNHWDNVMPVKEKHSMLKGMAYLYRNNPTDPFDSLYWEVKESVALSVGRLVGLDVDMGTFYGQKHLNDLRNQYWD